MHNDYKTAIICDLDFTLVSLNTTEELLKLIDPLKTVIFRWLLLILSLTGSLFKKDITKLILANLVLRGKSKIVIEKYSNLLFYEIILTRKINMRLISIVKGLSSRYKVPLIMITASLDIIAQKFKSLGFTYIIARPTYYEDGIFIGFYDLFMKKHKIVSTLLSRKMFDKLIIFDDSPEQKIYTLCSNSNDCLLIRIKFCK